MINLATISLGNRFLRQVFLRPLTLGVTAVSLIAMPGYGADGEAYGQCVVDVTATGITTDQAAASCAGARFPGVLGECVLAVSQDTGIAAADVLEGCERSRRPEEVASCTLGIHSELLEQPSVKALEHCSRSLLPERYGVCVVELSFEAQLPVDAALDQCIRAGYRPWRTAPRQ
ncbi:MAG: hypothetical protein KTR27_13130 [Leptolyngbyaceae cyanobacterium MAG.088]|nr:hypothetical protein [Leptolyngbyaceae cyanobacterium MAG.088]